MEKLSILWELKSNNLHSFLSSFCLFRISIVKKKAIFLERPQYRMMSIFQGWMSLFIWHKCCITSGCRCCYIASQVRPIRSQRVDFIWEKLVRIKSFWLFDSCELVFGTLFLRYKTSKSGTTGWVKTILKRLVFHWSDSLMILCSRRRIKPNSIRYMIPLIYFIQKIKIH